MEGEKGVIVRENSGRPWLEDNPFKKHVVGKSSFTGTVLWFCSSCCLEKTHACNGKLQKQSRLIDLFHWVDQIMSPTVLR